MQIALSPFATKTTASRRDVLERNPTKFNKIKRQAYSQSYSLTVFVQKETRNTYQTLENFMESRNRKRNSSTQWRTYFLKDNCSSSARGIRLDNRVLYCTNRGLP